MSHSTHQEQPVSNLRPVTRHITTHREDGKAVIHSSQPGRWQGVRNNEVAFDLVYTTSNFPCDMNNHRDIEIHEALEQAGTGLVNPGGSVCRIVDFSPDNNPFMHRTKSIDYGVVLEGEIQMILDSGEVAALKRGDVAVQRGTMHSWKNPSSTAWARMLFVLLDSHPINVGGEALPESVGDLARAESTSDDTD